MAQFITDLGKRNPKKLELTLEEASAMKCEGFRFFEFNPAVPRFTLSIPYRIAQNLDTGKLTFMQ